MRAVALATLAGLTGCSALFMQRHDPTRRQAWPVCSQTYTLPILDVTGVAAAGLLFAKIADDDPEMESVVAIVGAGTLYASSMIFGILVARSCRDAREDYQAQLKSAPPTEERPQAPPPAAEGQEAGPCYPNRTCDAGLACDPRGFCAPGQPDPPALEKECVRDEHCPDRQACREGRCAGVPDPDRPRGGP